MPRQTLDDPTRRDDLFRSPDRMEEMDARQSPEQRALGVRTSRLRELLGLPPDGGLRLPGRWRGAAFRCFGDTRHRCDGPVGDTALPNRENPAGEREEPAMDVLVIYESMYGNTHLVADGIARGLGERGFDVAVRPVHGVAVDDVTGSALVVVGGPTHAHGMSRESTREAAIAGAAEAGSELNVDPDAEGDGLREWFDSLPRVAGTAAAAFDTRVHLAPVLTGRASKGIAKRLRQRGFHEISEPESFFVGRDNVLDDGEVQRAVEWGRTLAELTRRVADGRGDDDASGPRR